MKHVRKLAIAAAAFVALVSSSFDASAADPRTKGAGHAEAPTDGDFAHVPAAEQATRKPLPVYVEALDAGVVRVQVKYRPAGSDGWSRIELKRMGKGWGGFVPCTSVTPGPMRYWVQGFDASGAPIASGGDPRRPFVVPIRDVIAGDGPSLPGRAPPAVCPADDCPAGAPDCHAPPPEPAVEDSTPAARVPAITGGQGGYARWWFGLSGAVDFLALPGGDDLCALTASGAVANTNGAYCTNPDGSDFPRRDASRQNTDLIRGRAGHLDGGVGPGDVRALVAVDYALSPALLVGGRLGYVLNAYPGHAAVQDGRAFGPRVHVEARLTYLFGEAPLATLGFSPMAFVAGGLAEFDGHATSTVAFKDVPGAQPVEIWRTDGPWFLSAGGGFRYQLSHRAAFSAALKIAGAFGGVGTVLTYGPELAFQYGF